MPRVELMYWSMRVMAMLGVAMFLIAAVGAWLYRKRQARTKARWFQWTAIVAIAFPYLAATAGWILTEMGRQPWIVQDLLKTSNAVSPNISTATVATSLSVFVLLYLDARGRRLRPDAPLRARGPAAGRRRRRARREPASDAASPVGTERLRWASRTFWFVLIAVLWGGYFLLEGFDFGVGMLLPVLPRDERERGMMFESIGPVWDGNEVWLVVAGGATFAAFPAWYATMFSGFYIALLLILVLLIVRVVSFEWREKRDEPALADRPGCGRTRSAASAPPFIWGVALANLVHGVPLDSSHEFTGNFLDLFSAYTVARRTRGGGDVRGCTARPT